MHRSLVVQVQGQFYFKRFIWSCRLSRDLKIRIWPEKGIELNALGTWGLGIRSAVGFREFKARSGLEKMQGLTTTRMQFVVPGTLRLRWGKWVSDPCFGDAVGRQSLSGGLWSHDGKRPYTAWKIIIKPMFTQFPIKQQNTNHKIKQFPIKHVKPRVFLLKMYLFLQCSFQIHVWLPDGVRPLR